MANFFIYILISSVVCSLCGLSVLLLNRLAKGVSQRFKCSILTLAVIVPYIGVFAAPIFLKVATIPEIASTVVENEYREDVVSGYVTEQNPETPVIEEKQAFQMISVDIIVIAAWVWCAVAAFMLTYSIARHIRLSLILRKQRQLMSNSGTLCIYTVSMQISPFISGFFKPVIYIPYGTYTSDELELAVAHETAHYKRGDLYRRLLIMILNCVNWFNPAYRFVLKKLIQQTEFACDETVINTLGKDSDKRYGYMLLKTAEKGSKNGVLGVGLGSDAENLKRRIEMIMNNNRKTSRNARAVALCAFVSSAVICIGGCGAAMNVMIPPKKTESDGIWYNEYYDDRSQVPQIMLTGRYYLNREIGDDYLEVYDDGTMRIFGGAYFSKMERDAEENDYDEAQLHIIEQKKELLSQCFPYEYNSVMAVITVKDPDDPDRVWNQWYAMLASQYDIVLGGDNDFTYCHVYPNEEIKVGKYYLNGDPSTGQYIDITEDFGFQYVGFDFFGQHMESEKNWLDSLDEDERGKAIAAIKEDDENREKKRFYQIHPVFGSIIVKDSPTYQPSLGGETIDRIDENTLEFDKDHIYIYVG